MLKIIFKRLEKKDILGLWGKGPDRKHRKPKRLLGWKEKGRGLGPPEVLREGCPSLRRGMASRKTELLQQKTETREKKGDSGPGAGTNSIKSRGRH